MPFILHPCKSLCFPKCTITPAKDTTLFTNTFVKKPTKFRSFSNIVHSTPRASIVSKKDSILGYTHFTLCSRNGGFDGFSTDVSEEAIDDGTAEELEKLELLNKPSPVLFIEESSSEVEVEQEKPSEEEALAPFLKFFKGRDSGGEEGVEEGGEGLGVSEEKNDVGAENEEGDRKVNVEYYEPKPGDFVVGVVVSGNENKLDVNVGADLLGTMLTKEVLPLYGKEIENLLCDVDRDAESFMVQGKMGIVKNEEAIIGVSVPGRPVVEIGTILFAEVLGRTLSGRPLLSNRRLFRRIAWHRLRQIKQLNEPIEVRITEWNTGGLLTRIEGLRAFIPKAELVKRANSFTDLKENVGRRIYVQITQIDETKNNLILSEKEAWEKLNLREGTLLDGTVKKILPYGAQIKLGKTNRSGLLHVSNISRAEITSVSDILSVDENVKVLVVKSMFPDKISLSIADLESEPGLFLSDKARVFVEADMMAKKYKQKLPPSVTTQRLEPLPTSALPFENEALYANWKWFKFEK
ncbi:rps1A, partial [Mucuna pruriens]